MTAGRGPSGDRQISPSLRLVPLAAFLMVAPVVALVVLQERSISHLEAVSPEPVEALVSATEEFDLQQRAAVLSPHWSEAVELVAPRWAGLVTATAGLEGSSLASWDSVVWVDGIERVAVHSDRPFWRELRAGDKGPDVVALQEALMGKGLYTGDLDGQFGRGLARAVGDLARELGAPATSVFDPAWFVWLPWEPFDVESSGLKVAMPAPGEGTPVAVEPVELIGFSLSDLAGSVIGETEGLVFRAQGREVDLSSGTALATIEAQLEVGTGPVEGLLELAQPTRLVGVPASAIVASPDGRYCVWMAGAEYRPVQVQLEGGRPGVTFIAGAVDPGGSVLANPVEILGDTSCRS